MSMLAGAVATFGVLVLSPGEARAQSLGATIAQGWTFMEAGNLRKAEEAFAKAFETPEGKRSAEVYYGIAAVWWERRNAMAAYMWLSDAQEASAAMYDWDPGPDGAYDRKSAARRRYVEKNFTVIKLRAPKRGKPLAPLADPPPVDPLLVEFTERLGAVVKEGIEAKVAVQWVLLPNGSYWVGEELVTLDGGELDPSRADSWDLVRDGGKDRKAYDQRLAAIRAGESPAEAQAEARALAAREAEAEVERRRAREAKERDERLAAMEAERQAEDARRADEARRDRERRAAEARAAEEKARREADDARRAEDARIERERREAEEARRAEDARVARELREAEEARRADEARVARERREAEEARRAEEARIERDRRDAEEARRAKEARAERERREAEEARRAEDARAAEEARRKDEARAAREAALEEAAEEARRDREAREEAKARREDEARRDREERRTAQARRAAATTDLDRDRSAAIEAERRRRRADAGVSGSEADELAARRGYFAGGAGGVTVSRFTADSTAAELHPAAHVEVGFVAPLPADGLALPIGISYANLPVSGCSAMQVRSHIVSLHVGPRIGVHLQRRTWFALDVGFHVGAGGTWTSAGARQDCAGASLEADPDDVQYGVELTDGEQTGRVSFAQLGWQGYTLALGPQLEVGVLAAPDASKVYLGVSFFVRHDQLFALLRGGSDKTYFFRPDDGTGPRLGSVALGAVSATASMARFQFGIRGRMLF